MNKKIFAIVILTMAIIFVFAACKKEKYEVSYTVPTDDGNVIEVYEDEDGNEFVTNMDGDKIPVTTGTDGSYDNVEDLITETTTKKGAPATTKPASTNIPITTTKPASSDNTTTTTKPESPTNVRPSETTTRPKLEIGNEDAVKGEGGRQEDTISIDEILGRN